MTRRNSSWLMDESLSLSNSLKMTSMSASSKAILYSLIACFSSSIDSVPDLSLSTNLKHFINPMMPFVPRSFSFFLIMSINMSALASLLTGTTGFAAGASASSAKSMLQNSR